MSLDMDLWLRARRAHKVHEPMLDDFGKGTPVDLDVARGESGVEALESKVRCNEQPALPMAWLTPV